MTTERMLEKLEDLLEWWESDLDIEAEFKKKEDGVTRTILVTIYSETYYYNGERHYKPLRDVEIVDEDEDELIESRRFIDKEEASQIFENLIEDGWKLI